MDEDEQGINTGKVFVSCDDARTIHTRTRARRNENELGAASTAHAAKRASAHPEKKKKFPVCKEKKNRSPNAKKKKNRSPPPHCTHPQLQIRRLLVDDPRPVRRQMERHDARCKRQLVLNQGLAVEQIVHGVLDRLERFVGHGVVVAFRFQSAAAFLPRRRLYQSP